MVPQAMRRVLVVLVLAMALAGCESSKLDRAASVVVSGRVLAADGSPAGGAPVALIREPSIGEIFTGLLVVPLTFGLACLGEAPAAGLCRGRAVERTVTAADGTYSLTLTGRATQTAFGNAVDFTLSTAVSGASVTADFKIQTEHLVLPDLQAWQPAVTAGAGRVTWSPPAPGSYQVVVEDGAGQLVWSFDATRTDVTFDPRILEDTAGRLGVTAVTSVGAEGTKVTVRRQSGRVDYRSAAGPPLSRGRPCTAGAPAAPVTPCALTDGNFANQLPRPATTTTTASDAGAGVAETATVDLGRAAEVSLIVVRGCTCQVERSLDGQTWAPVGRSTGYTAVVPSRTGPARFVRLTGPMAQLREVSVWEGAAAAAPSPPAGAPPADTPAPALAPPGPPDAPAASRTGPALVALGLLLLAAVATAAGALAVRRR